MQGMPALKSKQRGDTLHPCLSSVPFLWVPPHGSRWPLVLPLYLEAAGSPVSQFLLQTFPEGNRECFRGLHAQLAKPRQWCPATEQLLLEDRAGVSLHWPCCAGKAWRYLLCKETHRLFLYLLGLSVSTSLHCVRAWWNGPKPKQNRATGLCLVLPSPPSSVWPNQCNETKLEERSSAWLQGYFWKTRALPVSVRLLEKPQWWPWFMLMLLPSKFAVLSFLGLVSLLMWHCLGTTSGSSRADHGSISTHPEECLSPPPLVPAERGISKYRRDNAFRNCSALLVCNSLFFPPDCSQIW